VIKEIPVEYMAVDEQVPSLWNEVKPKVTIKIHIKVLNEILQANWPIRLALISSFCSMKQLGIFLLPPGWDASPSQG